MSLKHVLGIITNRSPVKFIATLDVIRHRSFKSKALAERKEIKRQCQ